MTTASSARRVLLIGSLPSESRTPRNVFELVSKHLGPLISHLPDGEQNDRGGWFWTQIRAAAVASPGSRGITWSGTRVMQTIKTLQRSRTGPR